MSVAWNIYLDRGLGLYFSSTGAFVDFLIFSSSYTDFSGSISSFSVDRDFNWSSNTYSMSYESIGLILRKNFTLSPSMSLIDRRPPHRREVSP